MNSLTVVVLTKNEADRVARCVNSVPAGAKLVVIDSHSTDQTTAAARRAWLSAGRAPGDLALVERAWLGFTRTRNGSLKWVTTPWVLWLDADEWIEPDLAESLTRLDSLDAAVPVFQISRRSRFLGRTIRFGGWYPDRKRRLARAANCEWRSGPLGADVHENLFARGEASDRVGTITGHLGHEPFRDTADQADTNERYSSLLAEALARKLRAQGRSGPGPVYVFVKTCIKFFENYVWKLGFLDAKPGLIIALGSAKSLSMRLTKTRRLLEENPGH